MLPSVMAAILLKENTAGIVGLWKSIKLRNDDVPQLKNDAL